MFAEVTLYVKSYIPRGFLSSMSLEYHFDRRNKQQSPDQFFDNFRRWKFSNQKIPKFKCLSGN